jgi:UDP-N-acetyl-D-glucosamine dehydrogenase
MADIIVGGVEPTTEHVIDLRTHLDTLFDRVRTKQAVIGVIGLGYVGLPLAVAFAEAGLNVIGIDVNEKRVAAINRGESPVSDVDSERLARLVDPDGYDNNVTGRAPNGYDRAGRLRASASFDALEEIHAVIICVPTPLTATKEPDLSYIISAADAIAQRLRPGMLVVLESTTYPGTTEEILLPRFEAAVRINRTDHDNIREPMVVGQDFFLAFSPERIDPGRTDWTVQTTPKVIGGVTKNCLDAAQAVYRCAVERTIPVSLPRTAEMVKLLENSFRALNIALANEMAQMCERLGVDVWEVIEAAKTKPFGFMPFYPGPGLGGHCIPVDPHYLAWKLRALNFPARTIQLAAEINFAMPNYVVTKITNALNVEGRSLNGSNVLILGLAYKPDIGDVRESPSLELVDLLLQRGALVHYHDPYVPHITHQGINLHCVELNETTLGQADCVVIATHHSTYDWRTIATHSRLIIDTRNAMAHIDRPFARIIKL